MKFIDGDWQKEINLRDFIVKNYLSNRSGIALLNMPTNTVNEYVFNQRKPDLNNLMSIDFNLNYNSTLSTFSATGFYNRLAYHSNAAMLNTINNLFLNLC